MAKPDLGTKRLCSGCGAKFYDLNRTPIVCPKCETVFVPVVTAPRNRPEAKPAPAPVAEVVVPETADAELVSLEDAEAEQQGKKAPAAAGAEGGDDTIEDAAFIEEQEEGADVTDILGETPIEKEEET